ncbi:hypothetical protein DBR40_05365 [Pedobacter sp. KBW01]|uniref:hypothetical protein n=1 Tax=Pedobacter sp. KBW01 TaxID=2153364 RepID=UPI000F5A8B24|nr:hypothetical protein [Pedobacter sp. KBW01]RQO79150.1 hypothetical protein DBR40_05365 [Pedobacter sp. KBW01]
MNTHNTRLLIPSLIELNGSKVEFTTDRGMISIPVRAMSLEIPEVGVHVGQRPFGSLSPFDTDFVVYYDADVLEWLLNCSEEEFQAAMLGFWKTRKEAFVC